MQFTRVNNKSGCAGPLVEIRIPGAQIVRNLGWHATGPCASPVFMRPWAFPELR